MKIITSGYESVIWKHAFVLEFHLLQNHFSIYSNWWGREEIKRQAEREKERSCEKEKKTVQGKKKYKSYIIKR